MVCNRKMSEVVAIETAIKLWKVNSWLNDLEYLIVLIENSILAMPEILL